jgi:hypothetical protein
MFKFFVHLSPSKHLCYTIFYEFIYWDSEVESIPYSITFSMPEPDSGRGYSKKLVESLINK